MCYHFDKTRVARFKLRKTLAISVTLLRMLSAKGNSARLACVRHAASVRPEPGSNSQINILIENLLAQ